MVAETRRANRVGGTDPSILARKDSPPPRKRSVAARNVRPPPIQKEKHDKRTKDPGSTPNTPEAAPLKRKRAQYVNSEGSEADEDVPTRSTSKFSLKKDNTNAIASPTSEIRNKSTTRLIPPLEVKVIEFPSLEEMASNRFIEILDSKNIIAHRIKLQGFSKLEVTVTKPLAEVSWKSITSSVKLPDKSKLGECSVFAIEAADKKTFEESAEKFLANNVESKSLKQCMALILHHDSSGNLQPAAMVGYRMGGTLYYCTTLGGETANEIAMVLNRTKDWRLEVPHEKSSKRRKIESDGSNE